MPIIIGLYIFHRLQDAFDFHLMVLFFVVVFCVVLCVCVFFISEKNHLLLSHGDYQVRSYHISIFVHTKPVSMDSSVGFQVVTLDILDVTLPDHTSK